MVAEGDDRKRKWWCAVGSILLCVISPLVRGAQVGPPTLTSWQLETAADQREYDARVFASVDYLNPDLEYSDKKLEVKGQHFLAWNEVQKNLTVRVREGASAVIQFPQPISPREEDAAYIHNRSAQLAPDLTFATREPQAGLSDFQRNLTSGCFECLRYVCDFAKSYVRRYSRYCCIKVVQDQYRQEVGCFRRNGRDVGTCQEHKRDWNECADIIMAGPCNGCEVAGWNTTESVRVDRHHGEIRYDDLNGVHAHTYNLSDPRKQRGVAIASDTIA